MNIQGWTPLRLTGLISLLSKGLSGIFSSIRRHQFFGILPSLLRQHDRLANTWFWCRQTLVQILSLLPASLMTLGKLLNLWTSDFSFSAAAKLLQSCPTLQPHRRQPTRLPVPGILQARILEWFAISFSNAWKWKMKVKSLSHAWLLTTPWTAAYQAPPSMGIFRQE